MQQKIYVNLPFLEIYANMSNAIFHMQKELLRQHAGVLKSCTKGLCKVKVSIVPIVGINLPNMLCPRSEWHIIMFSDFDLDIEEVAVPGNVCQQ